ncbi:MAG: V-containing nitrogenase subunit delta [Sphaerochaetaceae bacterium]
MNEQVETIVEYIQKRCLWQFFSRAWDRSENINGILTKAGEIFAGETPSTSTEADKCWAADAKILVAEMKSAFPWFKSLDKSKAKELLDGVRKRMREIAIDKSRNGELNIENY